MYVEGGGNNKSLRSRCREAFSRFLELPTLRGRRPKLVACGSRQDAYSDFCAALSSGDGETCLLLVDAEDVISNSASPWQHVQNRPGDNWRRPAGAQDEQLHFMAVCMESWLIADPDALAKYYGTGFNRGSLPTAANLEAVRKEDVLSALAQATQDTGKGKYSKGRFSFEALQAIDVSKVAERMTYCQRFVRHLNDLASR